MVGLLFTILTGSAARQENPNVGMLEEFGPYRALPITMNGKAQYALIDPLNPDSFAMTDAAEGFGNLLQIRYLGLEKDLKIDDTFLRSEEMPRSAIGHRITMVMGAEFFENKRVGIDYWNETIQVFEDPSPEAMLAWLKAGSRDEEPQVSRIKLTETVESVWVTDALKVDGDPWQLEPFLLDVYGDQRAKFEPAKWAELWKQFDGETVYSKALWRNVEFAGQPVPFFVGEWAELKDDLPGLRGSFALRDIGSRRAVYDAARHEIWVVKAGELEQACAVLGNQVFRFPIRMEGKTIRIGRIPRGESGGDAKFSGGAILGIDSYTAEEAADALLAGGEKRKTFVKDLIQRSKQRLTIQVQLADGTKGTMYVNSLMGG